MDTMKTRKWIVSIAALLGIAGFGAGAQPKEELYLETKQINYREGLIVFVLPKSWLEKYEPDGGGTFYEEGPDTGTLRLNVITAKSPEPVTLASVSISLLAAKYPPAEVLPNGNVFGKRTSRSDENGHAITTFSWVIAQATPPNDIWIASFAYTVLTMNEKSARTTLDRSFLEKSIRNASVSQSAVK